ncbi:MAG: protein deglycase [Clostridiales bacterium]|jgi:DJ-1 family protein|nr:protein deglycase [Clostridiales bacterium]MDN5281500.1 protein deglycase [Candidatus Ozemobacter sp.]
MSKNVVVFMAPGFEEMELTITVDILRRAGINVKIASLAKNVEPVTGSRGIKMLPDISIDEVDPASTDMIVLPGGIEGTRNLGASESVIDLVKRMNESQKFVAAICAAPAVLVKAGIAVGRKLTSHPAAKDHMAGVNYSENRVVKDGNIITSRAAGTTFEFAYAIIEELLGDQEVEKVNKGVLARI